MTTVPAAVQRPSTAYMPQLDGVRALAVLAVMVHHFHPDWGFGLPLGAMGVQLFFVLSGFLITRLLLNARREPSRARAIGRFYTRRFFRIFPLYYVTLTLALLLGIPDVRDFAWWHFTYTSNILFAKQGYFQGSVAHLWSLSVEEQFYVVWPFIILLMPSRRLLSVLLASVALAPLYRGVGGLLGVYQTRAWMWLFSMPFANLDSLGAGALLAFSCWRERPAPHLRRGLTGLGLTLGLPLALVVWLHHLGYLKTPALVLANLTFENLIWAGLFVWLIDRASGGFRGRVGRWLASPIALFLGKISYGLYVIHLFVPDMLRWGAARVGLTLDLGSASGFLLMSGVTVGLASLSWYAYERPLNQLKERFS